MRTHCFKGFISICHSNDYNRENSHFHTVEVAAFVKYPDPESDITKVEDVKKIIDSCYEPYQEAYINDMEGFEKRCSIEHLGEMLFYRLNQMLNDNDEDLYLEKVEIGETPLRTFIVTRTV